MNRGLFSVAAVPGIVRPPNYRSGPPVPVSEVVLAAIAIIALLAFGVLITMLWNRFERSSKLGKR